MAAAKPIISTKIKDVVTDYSHCVALIENADEFCRAISGAVAGSARNDAAYSEILANTSWNATVAKMNAILKNTAL